MADYQIVLADDDDDDCMFFKDALDIENINVVVFYKQDTECAFF